MASIFGHSAVGFTLAKLIDKKNGRLLLFLAIFSTILPDFDVIGFKFGISYSHVLGHRGFTHSIVFAVLWTLILIFTLGRKNKLIWFLVIFLSTMSHGILHAMTSGGEGVGFLIPFNNIRYFFPFREIVVSPLGLKNFFSEWGTQVILSEIKYVILPCFFILAVRILIKKVKKTFLKI
ncbi:metal-dependent hydrolase [Sabulilitoribacter arenilitoris]|uniref:Metal-dependent hydrolase n=1 Tax=Wocania arenilitoris TaxID=2044858 RepID=A0AAE3JMP3_9FLAO|nr:metal-dependent hydrolase [Wocania arenilitoris]MCF7569542.1 metal-dependent hydrolase [Wocania arenilitoris]